MSEPLLFALTSADSVAQIARQAGFRVSSGLLAVDMLADLESSQPEVLVLDLEQPEMNAFELLRKLADREVTGGIVLLSALDRTRIAAIEQYAMQRGLNFLAYLRKPYVTADLLRMLLSVKASGPQFVELEAD